MLPESCGWQSSACATRHSSRPVKNVTMNQPARRIRTDVTLMAVPFILLPLQPGSDSWSRRAATVGPFVRWGSGGTCRKKKRTGLRDSPLHIYFCDEILEAGECGIANAAAALRPSARRRRSAAGLTQGYDSTLAPPAASPQIVLRSPACRYPRRQSYLRALAEGRPSRRCGFQKCLFGCRWR